MFQRYSQDDLLKMIKKDLRTDHQLVFDCDGTLIDGDVSTLTGWQLMKSGMVDSHLLPEKYRSPSFYTKMNLIDYDTIRKQLERDLGPVYTLEWEVRIQSGIPHSVVVDYAHKALDFGFSKSLVSYTEVLPNFLKNYLEQSWVVSGSSFPSVAALAEKLGLNTDRVLATRLELVDGIYQNNFVAPGFVWEKEKVSALKTAGVENPYFVAGDSAGDWYMMEIATNWAWCVIWEENHFGAKNFRKFLCDKMPFGQDIPTKAGFYVTEWQRKHWVFQVMG
jgi:phosphoserine phosphatase